jgi:hypothetical protein
MTIFFQNGKREEASFGFFPNKVLRTSKKLPNSILSSNS